MGMLNEYMYIIALDHGVWDRGVWDRSDPGSCDPSLIGHSVKTTYLGTYD